MRRPVFLPLPLRDHLVVAKERAVEEHHVGARDALAHRGGHRGGARDEDDAGAAAPKSRRRHWRRSRWPSPDFALEIERHLAGHRESSACKPAGQRKRFARRNRPPRHEVGRQRGEHRLSATRPASPPSRRARTARARAGSAGPRPGRSRRRSARTASIGLPRVPRADAARAIARICAGRSGDALSRTQFSPSADTARLAWVRGSHARIAGPRQATDRATAIPLRKTAACRRAENDGGQAAHSGLMQIASGSEFGRQIAVDLEADADFDESRVVQAMDRFP